MEDLIETKRRGLCREVDCRGYLLNLVYVADRRYAASRFTRDLETLFVWRPSCISSLGFRRYHYGNIDSHSSF